MPTASGGVSRVDTIAAIRRPTSPRPITAAIGRWIGSASVRSCSTRSTPSSMITNRNSTTIAPAYTITCTAARKWASIATKCTATPNSVSTKLSAECTGWR